jgi:hypothetical protein
MAFAGELHSVIRRNICTYSNALGRVFGDQGNKLRQYVENGNEEPDEGLVYCIR